MKQEEIIKHICLELYQIWQEAKRFEDDNWDNIQYDDLSDSEKIEYEKTAKRIMSYVSDYYETVVIPARLAEERQKIINWLFEPCQDHPIGQHGDMEHPVSPGIYPIIDIFRDHRYECVECMRQLKEMK